MWMRMHVDQSANVCDGRRLHPCVWRGCLQLCGRPSTMHASTLLPQLWRQPRAEVGALYQAAARFFKAGKSNRVSGGGTRNEVPGRRSPTSEGEEVIKPLLCLFATSERLTSNSMSLPTAPDEEAPAACGEGLVKVNWSLSPPLSVLRGKRSQRTSAAMKMRKETRKQKHPKSWTDLMRHSVI